MKTLELNGIALDYAVTLIENPDALKYGIDDWRQRSKYQTKNREFLFRWASSWAQAGPIIEREQISIEYHMSTNEWLATRIEGPAVSEEWGDSPLVAVMRCYVAAMLGDEVDIPNELMEGKQ